MLREVIHRISHEFIPAKIMRLKGNAVAQFIREDGASALRDAIGDFAGNMRCLGSPGRGNWAEVPWLAVLDPVVTVTATGGYYVVYLFAANMRRVYLSLNQGTTLVRAEFGARARNVLRERAAIMRERTPEYAEHFSAQPINLASSRTLGQDYEAGHAWGLAYDPYNLPDEATLRAHLRLITELYLKLTFRGGLEAMAEPVDTSDENGPSSEAVAERRRYRYHRRIERNPKASNEAKRIHGYLCQTCGFDFYTVYGDLGRNYIEAHHLTPLSELPEDKPVSLDPKNDFRVLCANCHRMIHRREAPRALQDFKKIIVKN